MISRNENAKQQIGEHCSVKKKLNQDFVVRRFVV